MDDLSTFLKLLIGTPGIPGREDAVRQVIQQAWQPYCDSLQVSRLGSLHGLQAGKGGSGLRIMFSAHMDRLGLMVTAIEGELLRIASAGGVDVRVLAGAAVTVHGKEDIPGMVIMPASRLMPAKASGSFPNMESLWVDTGLEESTLKDMIQAGSPISLAQEALELTGGIVAGPGLDNRVSVAALTACLMELREREHDWDVWAVASVQEETGAAGAATSTYQIKPDLGIAIDATFAKSPGSNEYNTFPLGKGLSLGWGPDNHPGLYRAVAAAADRLGIPWAPEFMPEYSGTDATLMQVTAGGMPTLAVSIPVRYMHSPVEMVALSDIQHAGRLLAEFAAGLDENFLASISLENEP
jgi:endoglucanase